MPIAIEFFVGHAYAILFLWVLVEQLGLPVPSIPLLLTAGTLSATHRVHTSHPSLRSSPPVSSPIPHGSSSDAASAAASSACCAKCRWKRQRA